MAAFARLMNVLPARTAAQGALMARNGVNSAGPCMACRFCRFATDA